MGCNTIEINLVEPLKGQEDYFAKEVLKVLEF